FSFQCCFTHRGLHAFPTRRSSDLQIHQHGLAAADVAENVETLDQLRLARSEQPAQGGGLVRETTLGESFFELRQPVDDRLLAARSEEHTSELQSPCNLVCRLLLEK